MEQTQQWSTEHLTQFARELCEAIGLQEVSVDLEEGSRRLLLFANEGEWFKKMLPYLVSDLNQMFRLISQKHNIEPVFVDVNNYRKERERIIIELAKAAARKAVAEHMSVSLPAMNAYERRLIHTELATRPDVKTESTGEGQSRAVVIKPL
jgi:predicted RNA-binding protein Jag